VKLLREWRSLRLMSARQLAEQAGITQKTLIDVENGRRVPTFQTMRALCDALDVQPEDVEEFVRAIELRGKDAA
jgi:transcriptional regulator with XRE-family HTH domain